MREKLSILFAAILLLFFGNSFGQKTVFVPTEWSNPANEYYGKMSDTRKYESTNFVVYWGDIVGTNPATYSDANLRFNPKSVADTLETSFSRMITDLKFINNSPTTNFGKYKIIVVIYGTFSGGDARTEGFAVGSSYSNTIGAMFLHPSAVKDGGALSHEFAHTLQMMMHIQENPGNGTAFAGYDWAGPFFETHANFMRAQVYQKWTQIDGTLTRWIQTRNYLWSSNRHHYTCYNLLFYVQEKDGFDMTRRLWAESKNQEHPIETLKRLKGFTQEQLNDYLWGYAAKDVAFDYPIQWNGVVNQASNFGTAIRSTYQLIKNNLPRYTSRQYTLLDKVAGSTDRYFVNENWAPQDYGINIIPLYPTCTATDKLVSIKFKGHTEVNPTYAGWRYGFVTTKSDGTVSRYSPMYSSADGEASFNLNTANEANIYLVVFSAPKIHSNYNMDVGYPKTRRYPYELKIANAVPEGYQAAADFRKWRKTNGKLHSNGGGWISNNANVASTAYVGPYAMVLGGTVSGNARIEGFATVQGGNVSGNAIVKDNACIYNATISDNAVISGNAWMEGGSVANTAQVQGNAMVWAASYGNSVVVGGDAEIGSCSTNGVYLQTPYWRNGRTDCDGKGASDASNVDINPTFTFFTDVQMNFASSVSCNGGTYDCANVNNGTATIDACGVCVGGTTGKTTLDTDSDGTPDCTDTDDDNDGIADANDCNPINATVKGAAIWYADTDGDGFGDPAVTQTACTKPTGYVADKTDLCPADPNKKAAGNCGCGKTEQSCLDCAGVANGTAKVDACGVCVGGTTGKTTLDTDSDGTPDCTDTDDDNDGVADANDCNPTNATVKGATIWYVDTDGDGFGDPAVTKTACTKPTGYVADKTDLCPTDPNKKAAGNCGCGKTEQSCLDCAGVANGTAKVDACGVCVGGTTGKITLDTDSDGTPNCTDTDDDNDGVADANDCNPTNATIKGATIWYADTDGDGFGDPAVTQTACTKPTGYVADKTDLCPTDPNKKAAGNCGCGKTEQSCLDCAGVANGTAKVDACGVCVGGTTGKTSLDTDSDGTPNCTDTDDDNDGVADANDCNPTNATIQGATTWYADTDGDGFGDPALTITACGTKPTGYVTDKTDLCPTDPAKKAAGNCGCGKTEQSCLDCAGVSNGSATVDGCGVCVGGNTGKSECSKDCNEEFGGNAYFDECQVCVGGNTGKEACVSTGVSKVDLSNSLEVFPNPTTGMFTLRSSQAVSVKIIDSMGREVAEFNNIEEVLYGESLSAGMYHVIFFKDDVLLKTINVIRH